MSPATSPALPALLAANPRLDRWVGFPAPGRVAVSTAGTLSTRARGGRPVSFNFVTIDPAAVQVTFFRWDSAKQRFQPSDTAAFARRTPPKTPSLEPQAAQ